MKFFGRSKTEQFDAYTSVLESIEREVFFDHVYEMTELLELASEAYDSHGHYSDDEQNLYTIQQRIRKLLRKLDANMLDAITKQCFLEKTK